jgi:hypothetical protein
VLLFYIGEANAINGLLQPVMMSIKVDWNGSVDVSEVAVVMHTRKASRPVLLLNNSKIIVNGSADLYLKRNDSVQMLKIKPLTASTSKVEFWLMRQASAIGIYVSQPFSSAAFKPLLIFTCRNFFKNYL